MVSVCCSICIFVCKSFIQKKKVLYALIPVLLVAHLSFAAYGLGVACVMNWLFMGLPCFLIGAFLRDHQTFLVTIKAKTLLGVFVALYIWAVIEMYANDSRELYMSSLIIAVVAMVWAIQNPDFNRGAVFQKIGNEISLYVYMFQSLIFWVTNKILWRIPMPAKDYLAPIIGAICTVVGCFFFNKYICKRQTKSESSTETKR